MNKNVLLRTNTFICVVIIFGFLLTSVISYSSNNGIFRQDIEHITTLTSEGIYHEIDSIFTKPINISLTMANDSLLKSFLTEEEERGDDEAFIQTMRDYLLAYKEKYGYDSVFLASARTNRYYHFEQGVDRMLTPENLENEWYYTFLEDPKEYSLNIDNDEVLSANNTITIFINCKIYSPDGETMGVVGVGFNVDTLQKIFQEYEDQFGLRAYLADTDGSIEISTTNTGYAKTDLFEDSGYSQYKETILSNKENTQSFWYSSEGKKGFLITKYVPTLKWHLIIEHDTTTLETRLSMQFLISVAVVISVIVSVLVVITGIVRKYNAQIVRLTIEKEKKHRTVFQIETEKLYENIYEIDITHDRAASEATESYFDSLGASGKMPYSEALKVVVRDQIKEEYRDGYVNTFSPENVLKAYQEGNESLSYDFMLTSDGGHSYYWMRITARIFYWKDDQSVRMLVYRQNIDNEKKREVWMAEKMQLDSLSGLYNKAATQELISRLLNKNPDKLYAFFILDIDNFKSVNDACGHAAGDLAISDFAGRLKQQFHNEDITGRIGGDEFVAFVPAVSKEWVQKKADHLARTLQYEFTDGTHSLRLSASIGIALAPESGADFETLYKKADSALYQMKGQGKKGYIIYPNP